MISPQPLCSLAAIVAVLKLAVMFIVCCEKHMDKAFLKVDLVVASFASTVRSFAQFDHSQGRSPDDVVV
jgi:hypothetical protein